ECLAFKHRQNNQQTNPSQIKLGKLWFRRFMSRHKSIKNTSGNTIMEYKRWKALQYSPIENFLLGLELQLQHLNINSPSQLLAFDETGFSSSIGKDSNFIIRAVSQIREEWGKKSL